MTVKKKIFDICSVTLAGVLLLSGVTALFVMPKEEYSEGENRTLASLEEPTPENILNGSFSASVSAFFTDHFPLRQSITALKTVCELSLGKTENNGVIYAKDGYLLPTGEYESFSTADRNFLFLSELAKIFEENKKPYTLCLVPRGIDLLSDKLPSIYRGNEGEIWQRTEESGLRYLSVTDRLLEEADKGEYICYKTDHHLTSKGAYVLYTALCEELGSSPYDESFFTIETVSEDFYGTSYSKIGNLSKSADSIQLYRYKDEEGFTVTISESGESFTGFYRYSELEKKDKYRVFLGGNYSKMTVTRTDREERESLLLIKDSYANALIPFLALHYDLTVIDPRYYHGEYESLIADSERVLVLQGIDTVATTALK